LHQHPVGEVHAAFHVIATRPKPPSPANEKHLKAAVNALRCFFHRVASEIMKKTFLRMLSSQDRQFIDEWLFNVRLVGCFGCYTRRNPERQQVNAVDARPEKM
jgi:hypothetical protein